MREDFDARLDEMIERIDAQIEEYESEPSLLKLALQWLFILALIAVTVIVADITWDIIQSVDWLAFFTQGLTL